MASIFQTFPLLRRAAPRLTKEFFVCSARPASTCASRPLYRSIRQTPFLKAFRSQTTHAHRPGTSTALGRDGSSPLGALSGTISLKSPATRKAFFPETSDKAVAYWLLGSAASVFGIVVFGGLTRLTESGYAALPATQQNPPANGIPASA